jgi:EAL domain-containing protein (putative c-di-GMP-specific phosphodiesterase class I)/GGDEF domain-containing protein
LPASSSVLASSTDSHSRMLQLALGRFAALAFCRADLLFELDDNHKIVFCAGAVDTLLGKQQNELNGTTFSDLVGPDSRDMVNILLSGNASDARINDVEIQFNIKNNPKTPVALAGYRVPDFDNNFFLAVKVAPRSPAAIGRRSPDREEETNVLNPKAFASVAADRIQTLQDAGGTAKVSMIKIDNIDEIKNNLSADKQSKVLGAIGDILNENSLGGDTGGQIDDGNFSVLHSDDTSAEEINAKISAAAKSIDPQGAGVTTTTSTLDANMEGLSEEQMQKALLHAMKKFSAGNGTLTQQNVSGMFEEKMAETVKAVEAFRRVCAQKHFDLVYMPICSLETGGVHHFEALTRFRGNAGGLDSSPYELITLAEEVGIISEFDLVVAEKAIEMIKERKGGGGLIRTAINVSGHSISDEYFVKSLHDLLDSADGLHEYLSLEITESAEIGDLDGVNASIQSFREKGYGVSLDDFGAGAASFDYLNSFDVDTVKFDGPVVQRAYRTQKGKAFLASMATLCHQSGIETIAEMVETAELAQFLTDCGVNLGQGYYFGKPDYDITAFEAVLP